MEYGTIEFWEKEIEKKELERFICISALRNVTSNNRYDIIDDGVICDIARKLTEICDSIEYYKRELDKLKDCNGDC